MPRAVAAGGHGLCRQHQFLRRAHPAGHAPPDAARWSMRSSGCLQKATEAKSRYRAARRSRGAALCAGRACHGGAHRDRLADRRRVVSRRRSSPPSPCSSSPAPARWRSPFRRCRWSRPAQLFRSSVILNSGDAIERLAEVDTVIFDKTGTLTLPDPEVDAASIDPEMLERAARLALSSRHPLAVALARRARERAPYPGAVEEPGQGVRAVIDGATGAAWQRGLLSNRGRRRDRRRARRHSFSLRAAARPCASRSAKVCGPMPSR